MTKLNEIGIAHYLVPLSFVVLFAFIGVRIMTASHAAVPDVYHAIGYVKPADIETPLLSHTNQLTSFTTQTQQTANARNWAGYSIYSILPKTLFRGVQATWVQPKITCHTNQEWVTFWVGLDGWTNGHVEQAGSEAYCITATSAPIYNIWWEVYPNYSIQVGPTINAGDTVTALVIYNPANTTITMAAKDVTTGQSFVHSEVCTGQVTCPRTSAEIVSESVAGSTGYYPVPNYGKVTFTKVAITDSEPKTGPIANFGWRDVAITEQAGGIKYASVSALNAQGTAFGTTWLHK